LVQLSSKKKLPSAFGFHWTQDSQFASCESLQLVCQKVGSTIWKLMLENNLILTIYKKKIFQASYLIVFWLPLPTWTSWILFKFLVKQQEKCIWTLECKYKACSHRSIDSHLVRGGNFYARCELSLQSESIKEVAKQTDRVLPPC